MGIVKFNKDGSIVKVREITKKIDKWTGYGRSKDNERHLDNATLRLANACKVAKKDIVWRMH